MRNGRHASAHRLERPLSLLASALLHAAILGLPVPAPEYRTRTQGLKVLDTLDVVLESSPAASAGGAAPAAASPAPSRLVGAPGRGRSQRARVPREPEPTATPRDEGASSAAPSVTQLPAQEQPSPALDEAPSSPAETGSLDSTRIGFSMERAAAPSPATASSRASAPSSATSAPASDSRARYVERLSAEIGRHRQYPYLALRQGLQGTVCLRVALRATGELGAVQVTCGRSLGPLVEAARSAVFTAAPFAPLPAEVGASLVIDLPIVFQLEHE